MRCAGAHCRVDISVWMRERGAVHPLVLEPAWRARRRYVWLRPYQGLTSPRDVGFRWMPELISDGLEAYPRRHVTPATLSLDSVFLLCGTGYVRAPFAGVVPAVATYVFSWTVTINCHRVATVPGK